MGQGKEAEGSETMTEPCQHKRVYYVGLQPQEHPYPPLELATCFECGSTVSMNDKGYIYTGIQAGKSTYQRPEFMSDARLDI